MALDVQEIFNFLESEERVKALKHIVSEISNLPSITTWDCPNQGAMYFIRFFRNSEYCYAIIPAKKWLLWYFRKPALAMFNLNIDVLRDDFPPERIGVELFEKVNRNNAGEITVRLFGMKDAQLLTQKYLR